jgi:hypothetical protein
MNIVVDVSAMPVETLTITVLAREGRSMATKLVTQKDAPARAKKTVAKKAAAKKALPPKAKAKKAPVTPEAGKTKTKPSRSGLPAATRRALKELEAGNVNRYADADDLFEKLGIKLGQD